MAARTAVGVNIAVEPDRATVAATLLDAPAAFNVKLDVVKVEAVIAVLKLATTVVLMATPVAALTGVTAVTVGAGAVVKLHKYAVPKAAPAALVTVPAMFAV